MCFLEKVFPIPTSTARHHISFTVAHTHIQHTPASTHKQSRHTEHTAWKLSELIRRFYKSWVPVTIAPRPNLYFSFLFFPCWLLSVHSSTSSLQYRSIRGSMLTFWLLGVAWRGVARRRRPKLFFFCVFHHSQHHCHNSIAMAAAKLSASIRDRVVFAFVRSGRKFCRTENAVLYANP